MTSSENRGENWGEDRRVLAVIPCHNEAATIGGVIRELHASGFQVAVIDDCSTDDTLRIAQETGAVVLHQCANLGYGLTLQTGYRYALNKGFDAVVQLDGDGQHPPRFARELVMAMYDEKADIVIGSRFLDSRSYRVPLVRRLGKNFFGWILKFLTGLKITDPTSGYQALSARTLRFYIGPLFPDDYPDANVLLLAHRMGFTILEKPVVMMADKGVSMHRGFFRPLFYVVSMFLSILICLITKLPEKDASR